MPTDIYSDDTDGLKWQKLQAWVKQACINAGIVGDSSDPYLRDIYSDDSDGTKWCKLQRWIKLLAENVGGSGVVTELTASRDAVAADNGAYIYGMSTDTIFDLTLQAGTFPVGAEFRVVQLSAQSIRVVAGSGVTYITGGTSVSTAGIGTYLVLKQVTQDNWSITAVGAQTAIPDSYLLNYASESVPVAGVLTISNEQTLATSNILVNLTADVTSIVNTNAFPYGGMGPTGWNGTLTFVQDGTGGHSVTFPAAWKFPGGVAPKIDKTPGAVTVIDVHVVNWSLDIHASARNPQHRQDLIAVTGSRDLAATDADSYLYGTAAATLTVKAGIFPAGAEVDLFQAGSGQLQVAADGVTIISKGSNLKLAAQGSAATLKHIGSNVWHLVGDLTA